MGPTGHYDQSVLPRDQFYIPIDLELRHWLGIYFSLLSPHSSSIYNHAVGLVRQLVDWRGFFINPIESVPLVLTGVESVRSGRGRQCIKSLDNNDVKKMSPLPAPIS